MLVPLDQLGDLAPPRLQPGETERSSELRAGFDQGDLVAPLGCDPRRLEPGRAATDDEHRPPDIGRFERVATPLELPPRRRVDQARDPVVT